MLQLKTKTNEIYENVEKDAAKFKDRLHDKGKCLQLAYDLYTSENNVYVCYIM